MGRTRFLERSITKTGVATWSLALGAVLLLGCSDDGAAPGVVTPPTATGGAMLGTTGMSVSGNLTTVGTTGMGTTGVGSTGVGTSTSGAGTGFGTTSTSSGTGTTGASASGTSTSGISTSGTTGTATSGTSTGTTMGAGGTGGGAETTGTTGAAGADPMPWFTFFQPSMEGLLSLAPSPDGFGGDLGGLAGADAICTTLAQRGNPGDTKVWRAFLSAAEAGPDGGPVHAIERIGSGPWHDYNNLLLANDVEGLMQDSDGRPIDADDALAEMFTDEYGAPVSIDPSEIDNHDTLTGSDETGRLPEGAGPETTCNDWTSTDEELPAPIIGHAWPRSANSGRNWINEHDAGGCGAGISTVVEPGNGTPTVGANGGYGAFYCFAVSQ